MDSATKAILVAGVVVAGYFGYQAFVANKAAAPQPTAQQNSPNANQQPAGPSSMEKLAGYGAGIGAGVGALKDIYKDIWG